MDFRYVGDLTVLCFYQQLTVGNITMSEKWAEENLE